MQECLVVRLTTAQRMETDGVRHAARGTASSLHAGPATEAIVAQVVTAVAGSPPRITED
jgi:hypothetical protein